MKIFRLLLLLALFLGFRASGQDLLQMKSKLAVKISDTTRLRVLNELAEYFFTNLEYDSCKKYAENALQLSQGLLAGDAVKKDAAYAIICKKYWARSMGNLATTLMTSHTKAALDSFRIVEQYYAATGNKDELALTYQRMGETYANQNNNASSIANFNKSLGLYQALKNRNKIAYLYYNISLTQRGMAMYGDALESNLKALEIAKEIKDTVLTIECLLANGFIYMLAKDYPAALKSQQEGLAVARAIKDSSYIATAFSDLGNTNMRLGRLDESLSNFSEALNIRKRLKLDTYLSSNLLYLSSILVKQGKYKEAIAYNFESLDYAKKFKDGRFILDAYSDLASNFQLIPDEENALKYYDTLYQVSLVYNDKFRQSIALQGMATVYMHQKKLPLAQSTLIQAISITDSNDYRNLEAIYENLAMAYNETGNYKMAYQSGLQFKRYSDSVSALEKAAKLASLTNQLEFQNKKMLLKASQDKQLSLQLSEINRQKLVRNITIVGLMIAFIWALIFFKRFREKRKMNIQLQKTLEELKAAQVQLVHSEKMASLGELTAGIAHEIQNPLNFVNNFSEVNKELVAELVDAAAHLNFSEVQILANDIKENSEKINHHGKRAEGIVKGMLHHSRKSEGKKEPTDINALCDEYLRLSYHGLRAKDKSFNAKFESSFDDALPKINVVGQDIGRTILNLINNAFYAVSERRKTASEGYEPTVNIVTRYQPGKAIIKVQDNGNGIPKSVFDKIFQPFFTTKPTGQGTGLGLSLSYDIIKAHGGDLKVTTKEARPDDPAEKGEGLLAGQAGTEFMIQLPINN